jgi:voltage-gated potassium channel
MGYAIIAVPTGIITVEMSKSANRRKQCRTCRHYNLDESKFCNNCGTAY